MILSRRGFLASAAAVAADRAQFFSWHSTAGTTPVLPSLNFRVRASTIGLSDGTLMSSWADSVGGFDLTQATTNNKPLFCVSNPVDVMPFACWDFAGAAPCVMSNGSYPVDKRAFSLLWIGSINSLARTGYLAMFGASDVILEQVNGVLRVFNGSNRDTTFCVPTTRTVAIVVTCGPSGVNVYLDGASNVQTLAANSVGTVNGITIGDAAGTYYGDLVEVCGYNAELGVGSVATLFAYAAATYGTGAAASVPAGRVVWIGDSTSEGIGATRNQPWPQRLAISRSWLGYSYAQSGLTLVQMLANIAAPNVFAASGNWPFVYGGYNDLGAGATGAQVETRLAAVCNALISAGYPKANITTSTLAIAGFFAERDDANTRIRANYTGYAGTLVDVAADAQLGVDLGSGFKNPSYYIDAVHDNDTGYGLYAALNRSTNPSLPF